MASNSGQSALLPYREDHIGLTRWPVAIAIGLSVMALALLPTIPTWSQQIGALTLTTFLLFVMAAAVAWVLVYTGWVLGVAIDADQVRFGALRKAEARARRGLPPPFSPHPYATWLYEYRCPIPAIRRIWIVRGGRDALNPERATGVPTTLRVGDRQVARAGWIRTPFVGGGLMFQLDRVQAAMPAFGGTWRTFVPVPASSVLSQSDTWYTPVADPDRCRAALVEALHLNGLEVDAEGNVRMIPGVEARPSVTPPPSTPIKWRTRPGRLTTVFSFLWALIPLLTLGIFAWVPYVYAALRVRQLHTTLIALVVVGVEAVYWWLIGVVGNQTGSNPQGGSAFAGLMVLLAIGGTFWCFLLRREVFNIA